MTSAAGGSASFVWGNWRRLVAERPTIAHGSPIKIADLDCIVCAVRTEGDSAGDREVVFNPHKPTNGLAVGTASLGPEKG
jgi:hypothetical protein